MNEEYSKIIELVKREVVPAVGCTEPVVVALCTSLAAETLGCRPDKVIVRLSANMLKNAMGVGIPDTGMTGLPIATALGATVCKSADGLALFGCVDAAAVECARRYLETNPVEISLKENCPDKLYVEVEARAGADVASVVQRGSHFSRPRIERNGTVLAEGDGVQSAEAGDSETGVALTLRKVYDFAMNAPLEDIEFIAESEHLNMSAAELSFRGDYGHGLGRLLHENLDRPVMGDTLHSRIISYTSGACDVRMGGARVTVMSNSGSGNQGIAATVPVAVYGRETGASHEQMIRALMMSHLTVIYIKHSLGSLSALCGCVVAGTGASCGIVYLMGGGYEEMTYAVKNMVANLTGMICDGAKPSCAMKVATGASTALLSALLAMSHRYTSSSEGIIEDDVERCISNLTTIGRDAMNETDRTILDIMTHKCN